MKITIDVNIKVLRKLVKAKGTTHVEVCTKVCDSLLGQMGYDLNGSSNDDVYGDDSLSLDKTTLEEGKSYHGLIFKINKAS